MSGELEPELDLVVGTEIIVYDPNPGRNSEWTETVAKVARVWITTERGRRFRLDKQSEGLDFGWGGYHFKTAAQAEYAERVATAWQVLKEHGLAPAHYGESKELHDRELFAIEQLLRDMDQERQEG